MSDAVLVVGAGVAGLRVALEAAKAGASVVLVEREPTLGGSLSGLLAEKGASFDFPDGISLPSFDEVKRQPNIEVLTLSEVTGLAGEPGRFKATIRQQARFVSDACTQCNNCRGVCPVVLPNEYDADLTYRKAIFTPALGSFPATFAIDLAHCLNTPPNYMPCQRCVSVCEPKAISFDVPLQKTFEREVGSVVIAVGGRRTNVTRLARYGYGQHPDVVTGFELERLLAPNGPVGGYVERPSNEETPENALLVLNPEHAEFATSKRATDYAWESSARHALQLVEQDIAHVTVLYADEYSNGKAGNPFLRSATERGVTFMRGDVEKVGAGAQNALTVQFKQSENREAFKQEFDLVVLEHDLLPLEEMPTLAEALRFSLTGEGYIQTIERRGSCVATTADGIYALGAAAGSVTLRRTLADCPAVVQCALGHLRLSVKPVEAAATSATEALGPQREEPLTAVPSTALPADGELLQRVENVLHAIIQLGEKAVGR
ncbi:MAG: CoB--CoM heterodisulfide reductase iron-sulfur subunit A family protein [Candidatus Hydrogenedentes bacterium]|nr:CoB--CoM heterodisulfide reductase iron-sulfur subunit A family protein [Candidatus Hydrogenedentota bacterium]